MKKKICAVLDKHFGVETITANDEKSLTIPDDTIRISDIFEIEIELYQYDAERIKLEFEARGINDADITRLAEELAS